MPTRDYEAMFLVENNWAANHFDEVEAAVRDKVEKHGGSIERLERWGGEKGRRLAYPIKRERKTHTMGTYVLCHLKLDSDGPNHIYREVELDSNFLRALVLQRREDELDLIFATFPDTDSRGRPLPEGAEGEAGEEEDIPGDDEE